MRPCHPRRVTGRVLRVEPLEPRRMLSVEAPFVGPLPADPATDELGDQPDHLQETHEYIAQQAADLYRALFGIPGVELQFEDHVTRSTTSSWDTGNSICEGTVDEDAAWYMLRSMDHFAEGGDGSELTDGILFYGSAYTKAANENYPEALSYYASGDLTAAYYWLGRTMHLLQDMTVPAHVHNDQHAFGDDEYEDNAANYAGRFTVNHGDYWNFQQWGDDWSSGESLWDRSDDYATLEALFRETTDYTDDYDSDDYPGDWHNGATGDEFSLTRLEELDRAYHAAWASDYVTGDGSELSAAEVEYLARDVGTWAVEQSAMLMRYYFDDVSQVVGVPGNLNVTSITTNTAQIDWNDVPGAEGYVLYRSTSADSGFSLLDVTTASQFDDSQLAADGTYYYRIYAYSSVAGLGQGCQSVSLTTLPRLPGDATGDGAVDQSDAAILAAYWGHTSVEWANGDFNGDGRVNAVDAAILAANFGTTISSPPEEAAPQGQFVGPLLCDDLPPGRRLSEPPLRERACPEDPTAGPSLPDSAAALGSMPCEAFETINVEIMRLPWLHSLARRQNRS